MQKTIITAATLAALTAASSASAAELLFEDFEDATVTYTTSVPENRARSDDYFIRTDGSNINASFSNVQGSSYFAAQDIDGATSGATQTQTFSTSIGGFDNLSFSAFFAEDDDGNNEDWDAPDFVHVDYRIDGGTLQNLFWLENSGSTFNTAPFVDNDFDGVGEGAEITDTFTQFTRAIAGTGSMLDLIITYSLDSDDEDIAIDNVLITGDAVPPPNSDPMFTQDVFNFTAVAGETSNFLVTATDDDLDTLSFTSDENLDFVTVGSNGGIEVTPVFPDDLGFFTFGVTVDDGNGGLDNATVNLTVIPEPLSAGGLGLLALVGLRRRRA
jgi:hypothetical protein